MCRTLTQLAPFNRNLHTTNQTILHPHQSLMMDTVADAVVDQNRRSIFLAFPATVVCRGSMSRTITEWGVVAATFHNRL